MEDDGFSHWGCYPPQSPSKTEDVCFNMHDHFSGATNLSCNGHDQSATYYQGGCIEESNKIDEDCQRFFSYGDCLSKPTSTVPGPELIIPPIPDIESDQDRERNSAGTTNQGGFYKCCIEATSIQPLMRVPDQDLIMPLVPEKECGHNKSLETEIPLPGQVHSNTKIVQELSDTFSAGFTNQEGIYKGCLDAASKDVNGADAEVATFPSHRDSVSKSINYPIMFTKSDLIVQSVSQENSHNNAGATNYNHVEVHSKVSTMATSSYIDADRTKGARQSVMKKAAKDFCVLSTENIQTELGSFLYGSSIFQMYTIKYNGTMQRSASFTELNYAELKALVTDGKTICIRKSKLDVDKMKKFSSISKGRKRSVTSCKSIIRGLALWKQWEQLKEEYSAKEKLSTKEKKQLHNKFSNCQRSDRRAGAGQRLEDEFMKEFRLLTSSDLKEIEEHCSLSITIIDYKGNVDYMSSIMCEKSVYFFIDDDELFLVKNVNGFCRVKW